MHGAAIIEEAHGKRITNIELGDDTIIFTFEDGSAFTLFDQAQDCCEVHYFHTDDDLTSLIGSALRIINVKSGPDERDDQYGDVVETDFIEITTDKGFATICAHNSHNGYYSGISVIAVKGRSKRVCW